MDKPFTKLTPWQIMEAKDRHFRYMRRAEDDYVRIIADFSASGGRIIPRERPEDFPAAIRPDREIRPRISTDPFSSRSARVDYEKPIVRNLRPRVQSSFDSSESGKPTTVFDRITIKLWYEYIRQDFVMVVYEGNSYTSVEGLHDIGRWWCDNQASKETRRILWDGVFSPATLASMWIGCDFNTHSVEEGVRVHWSSLSGSSVLRAPQAGSKKASRHTPSAQRIATAYSRHRMKPMVVPTVMSGGVRK